MNKENINKYGVVFGLILIVIVLAVIKVKYGWKGETTVPLPSNLVPTETITATPTEATSTAEVLKVDETKYPLWEQLPYSGKGFLIDKYVAPKVLAVQLSGASTPSATKAINVWLKSFGDAGKGHKIEFEN
jgi:hypothetical protein